MTFVNIHQILHWFSRNFWAKYNIEVETITDSEQIRFYVRKSNIHVLSEFIRLTLIIHNAHMYEFVVHTRVSNVSHCALVRGHHFLWYIKPCSKGAKLIAACIYDQLIALYPVVVRFRCILQLFSIILNWAGLV